MRLCAKTSKFPARSGGVVEAGARSGAAVFPSAESHRAIDRDRAKGEWLRTGQSIAFKRRWRRRKFRRANWRRIFFADRGAESEAECVSRAFRRARLRAGGSRRCDGRRGQAAAAARRRARRDKRRVQHARRARRLAVRKFWKSMCRPMMRPPSRGSKTPAR